MNTDGISLANLVGVHLFSGVDRLNQEFPPDWEYGSPYHGECLRFTLDGVTYIAREDDNDGYRSAMRDLVVSDQPPVNTFPGVRVIASHYTRESDIPNPESIGAWESSDECDLLVLVREDNGKPVLVVGTDDIDDYYPGFVARYFPEALGLVEESTS